MVSRPCLARLHYRIESRCKFHRRFAVNTADRGGRHDEILIRGQVTQAVLFDVQAIRIFARHQLIAGHIIVIEPKNGSRQLFRFVKLNFIKLPASGYTACRFVRVNFV
jgi:hypothetical protein